MLLKAIQESCEKTTCVINEINVIIIIIISLFNVNKTKVENCNKKN